MSSLAIRNRLASLSSPEQVTFSVPCDETNRQISFAKLDGPAGLLPGGVRHDLRRVRPFRQHVRFHRCENTSCERAPVLQPFNAVGPDFHRAGFAVSRRAVQPVAPDQEQRADGHALLRRQPAPPDGADDCRRPDCVRDRGRHQRNDRAMVGVLDQSVRQASAAQGRAVRARRAHAGPRQRGGRTRLDHREVRHPDVRDVQRHADAEAAGRHGRADSEPGRPIGWTAGGGSRNS